MKTILLQLVTLLLVITPVPGQKFWSLRTNAGATSGYEAVDGYYFSFDIGIPIIKAVEICPTFTNSSMLSNTYINNEWDETLNASFSYDPDRKKIEEVYGENLSSISLLVNFKPFDLIKNGKWKNHELIIGGGLSYNSYIIMSSYFDVSGGEYELTGFSVKSNRAIEPYYAKVNYNYILKEKFLLGLVASINGFDGEAILLAGLQFGVKLK